MTPTKQIAQWAAVCHITVIRLWSLKYLYTHFSLCPALPHVKWHHGMVRLQVDGGGEGLQIWRVAVNILNK
jgi:hypothetical protein